MQNGLDETGSQNKIEKPAPDAGAGPCCYRVYGLRLEANRALPGLLPEPAGGGPDLQLSLTVNDRLQPIPTGPFLYTSLSPDDPQRPDCRIWWDRPSLHLWYAFPYGTLLFTVDQTGSRMSVERTAGFPIEETMPFLLVPAMGCVLRLRGTSCLHASVTAVEGKAVSFIGPSMSGKSTLVAALAGLGYPLLTDDVAAWQSGGEDFLVQPGWPNIRVFPDSVEVLAGVVPGAAPGTLSRDGRCVDLRLQAGKAGWGFWPHPLPLAAVYVLGGPGGDDERPVLAPLSAGQGLIALTRNLVAGYLLDRAGWSREFERLGCLVERVPVWQMSPLPGPGGLSAACSMIVADVKQG